MLGAASGETSQAGEEIVLEGCVGGEMVAAGVGGGGHAGAGDADGELG